MNKKSLFVLIAITTFFSNLTFAIDINSKVSAVTLYPNKARETRTGKINLQQIGEQEIVFTDISRFLDPQSLQVAIPGLSILSVTTRSNFLGKKTDQQQLKIYKDSLQDIQDKRAWLLERMAVKQGELKLYEQNISVSGDHTEHFTKAVNDLANLYSANTLKIREQLFQLKKEDKVFEESIQRLQSQINTYGPSQQPVQEVVVKAVVQKAGQWDYQIQYMVSNASWKPIYDIHAEQLTQPLKMKMKAQIVQQTGYDWDNVKLTLSTAQPQSQQKMPIWSTEFVDYLVFRELDTKRDMEVAYAARAMKSVDRLSAAAVAEEVYIVELTETATAQNYQISRGQNIASTKDAQFVEISNVDMPSMFQYESFPKKDAAVFLMAKVPQWESFNLLNGLANVFFEGTYVGQININAKVAKDTLDISLGRDELVFIDRQEIKNVTSKKVFGSKKSEDKIFEITIKNNKKSAVDVVVYDQIPVSRQKDIEVTLNESDKAQYTAENGKLEWKLNLKAGETRKVRFSYTLKYPSDKTIELK